jgi:hypothetical protein
MTIDNGAGMGVGGGAMSVLCNGSGGVKGSVGMRKSSVAGMVMGNNRGMLGKGNGARNGSGVGVGEVLCTGMGMSTGMRKGGGMGIGMGNGRGMRVGMGNGTGIDRGIGKGTGSGVGVCTGKGMGGVAVKTEVSVGDSASCFEGALVIVDDSDDDSDAASVPDRQQQIQQQRGVFVLMYVPSGVPACGRAVGALGAVSDVDGGAQHIINEQLSLVDEMGAAQ